MIKRVSTDKLSISLDKDVSAWIRRSAAKKRSSVSRVIQAMILPHFETRHSK